ncbi:hypothetical protein [Streptomyces melanogenes]|uniref:hypothetical protein n=1 Tax=Streptomyces melanogenes TaxID=67326 RepID=UPI0037B1422E
MIHQFVREKFGAEAETKVPHYTALLEVWEEWFGPEGGRQRYRRSAAAVDTGSSTVTITRPGQVVVLTSTPFAVKLRDNVFGEPISVDLTLGLDAFTHSGFVREFRQQMFTSFGSTRRWRYSIVPLEILASSGSERCLLHRRWRAVDSACWSFSY